MRGPAPRTMSINASASSGWLSFRHATCPSGRTSTSRRPYNAAASPCSIRCTVNGTPRLAADQAAVVLQRDLGGARRRRPPLMVVALDECRPAPAFDRGRELPAEIEGVLDAGVHAEPAVRRMGVRGIAGDADAPIEEAI